MYVPIIFARKGELHDNFEVHDSQGVRLPVLAYREYLQVVASVLRSLLLEAYGRRNLEQSLPSAMLVVERHALARIIRRRTHSDEESDQESLGMAAESYAKQVEERYVKDDGKEVADARIEAYRRHTREFENSSVEELLTELDGLEGSLKGRRQALGDPGLNDADRSVATDQIRTIQTKLDAIITELTKHPPHVLIKELSIPQGKRRKARNLASELVRELSDNYAVVARTDVPPDGRFIIRYKCTVIPQLRLGLTRYPRLIGVLVGWLRIAFGARPADTVVSLLNAGRCQSYHLNVRNPEGLFLHSQELDKKARVYLDKRADYAPTKPYIRFRRRLGQPYAHLYTRFFPPYDPDIGFAKLRCVFLEVPPGSAFRAAVAAVASAALIVVVGSLLSHDYEIGADVPAFLLALPAVAATWMGFDSASRRLIEPALKARLSLVLTAALSVLASALYLADRAVAQAMERGDTNGLTRLLALSMPMEVSVLGVGNLWWGLLILVSVLAALYMVRYYVLKVREFARLASRLSRDGGAEEG